jgi:hypothetical protein
MCGIRKHLCERFHRLYDISFNKGIKVEKMARSLYAFQKNFVGWPDWFDLLHIIHTVTLREGEDRITWKLGTKGFTVKSLYNALHVRKPVKGFRQLWNMKILGINQKYLMDTYVGKTLTKNNRRKRGWDGATQCMFCALDESIEHPLFQLSCFKIHLVRFSVCIWFTVTT